MLCLIIYCSFFNRSYIAYAYRWHSFFFWVCLKLHVTRIIHLIHKMLSITSGKRSIHKMSHTNVKAQHSVTKCNTSFSYLHFKSIYIKIYIYIYSVAQSQKSQILDCCKISVRAWYFCTRIYYLLKQRQLTFNVKLITISSRQYKY